MKQNRFFWIIFGIIILFSFLIRLLPTADNNFYFTMDQGDDAVHAREIFYRHQLLTMGPSTGLKGLFAGPLWYYFISFFMGLFAGHPFGGVFFLIILNVALSGIIIIWLAKRTSPKIGLLVGASLQIFWPFYDSSRYAFNPFPLVFLAFILLFSFIKTFEGQKNFLIWAAIPVGLAFHAEIAGAIAFLIFYLAVAGWFFIRRVVKISTLLTALVVLSIFFIPHLISELTSDFSQTSQLFNYFEQKQTVFSGTNFGFMSEKFLEIITAGTIPQNTAISLIFCLSSFIAFIINRKKNIRSSASYFIVLTFLLLAASWLWFSATKGWQPWQTVYLPPLIFVGLILMTFSFPRPIGTTMLVILVLSQFIFFQQQYRKYFRPFEDPSLLKNEMAAVDWAYEKSEGQGFYAYSYLPSVKDYPYQYLFWWRGLKKYGYLPCEYSSYPETPSIFVPGLKYYVKPKRDCSYKIRYLIIEPDKNTYVREQWLDNLRKGTELLEDIIIGGIKVEKRKIVAVN